MRENFFLPFQQKIYSLLLLINVHPFLLLSFLFFFTDGYDICKLEFDKGWNKSRVEKFRNFFDSTKEKLEFYMFAFRINRKTHLRNNSTTKMKNQ